MIAIPDIDKPKKVDGIKIDFHFEDGHIETHIIGIEEIIDIVKCWECINWRTEDRVCEYWTDPHEFCIRETEPDDSCSCGERRSDD